MSLYISFFNFLRLHSALNYKTPVVIDKIEEVKLMPNKWLALIKYSNNYICAA